MYSRTIGTNQMFKRPVHAVLASRLITGSNYCGEIHFDPGAFKNTVW